MPRPAPPAPPRSGSRRSPTISVHFLREGRPIVGICASGILIRALAPLLTDKRLEPPVLAVAEDGSAVVPLLGGHHGANALARTIAAALGVPAAITTAGDLRLGLALDEPPAGWRLADPEAAKGFTAALLEGASVRLDGRGRRCRLATATARRPGGSDRDPGDAPGGRDGPRRGLSSSARPRASASAAERGARAGSARGPRPTRRLAEAGLAEGAVACITSIDLKADEPAVHALAAALGVPARFLGAAGCSRRRERLTDPLRDRLPRDRLLGRGRGRRAGRRGPDAPLLVPKRRGRARDLRRARSPERHRSGDGGPAAGSLARGRHRPGRRRLAHARGRGCATRG